MEGLNLRASRSSWLTKQSVVEQATSFGEMAITRFALLQRAVC